MKARAAGSLLTRLRATDATPGSHRQSVVVPDVGNDGERRASTPAEHLRDAPWRELRGAGKRVRPVADGQQREQPTEDGERRGGGGEHESSRKVKSELLVQMDGVTEEVKPEEGEESKEEEPKKKLVMVLAASNIPWDLDEAIKRRLEKRIYIPLPTEVGRRKVFDINMRKMKVDPNIDWEKIVKITDGFSGADIASLCTEASF